MKETFERNAPERSDGRCGWAVPGSELSLRAHQLRIWPICPRSPTSRSGTTWGRRRLQVLSNARERVLGGVSQLDSDGHIVVADDRLRDATDVSILRPTAG
ncbi:hypothetical protein D8S78_19160 [Natrialba swarupiae]|nr:hypothetical protein [Natrialba swarupiae]